MRRKDDTSFRERTISCGARLLHFKLFPVNAAVKDARSQFYSQVQLPSKVTISPSRSLPISRSRRT